MLKRYRSKDPVKRRAGQGVRVTTYGEPEAMARSTLIKEREVRYGANMLTPTETAIIKVLAQGPSHRHIVHLARQGATRNHSAALAIAGLVEKKLSEPHPTLTNFYRLTAKGWKWVASYLPNEHVIG